MTISELIERLEALKAEHGDLPVTTFENGFRETEMVELASELDPHLGIQIAVGGY